MRTFVGTLRHIVHIMAFNRPLTNAVGDESADQESRTGHLYRHLDYFTDMIYLTVGDLDIPAQICVPCERRRNRYDTALFA